MVGTDEVEALVTQTGTSVAIHPSGLKELLGEPVHTYAAHSEAIYAALDVAYGANVAATRAPQDSKAFDEALTTRRVYLQHTLNPNQGDILPLEEALPVMEELYVLAHVHGVNLATDPDYHRPERSSGYNPTGIMNVAFKRYLFRVQSDGGDVKGAAIAIQKLVGRSASIDALVPRQEGHSLGVPTRLEIQTAVRSLHEKYAQGMITAFKENRPDQVAEYQNPAERFRDNHLTSV